MNAPTPTDQFITNMAGGVAGRLRSLVAALDRLDRLESGSGAWLAGFAAEELPGAAAELVLRALRIAADPANYTMLKALAAENSCALNSLIEITGLKRLVLSERLNDLVQVGLAARLIDTDHAQITAAGASIINLIEALIAEVAQQYSK